jgi:hypothetical protein
MLNHNRADSGIGRVSRIVRDLVLAGSPPGIKGEIQRHYSERRIERPHPIVVFWGDVLRREAGERLQQPCDNVQSA